MTRRSRESSIRGSRLARLVPWVAASMVVLAAVAAAILGWRTTANDPAPLPPVHDGATLVLDRAALAQVDLDLVHTELVPGWVVARGGVKRTHWARLRREAGHDPNLAALLDRMAQLIDAGPVLNAGELMALVRAWNDYLEKGGAPWRLSGQIAMSPDGGTLRLKSYRVLLDDAVVRVGEGRYPASLRARVDDTTQVDVWLGHVHSHEEGVVLLLDQLAAFALNRVWPMMDPALDEVHDPLQVAFGPAIRRSAAAVLGPHGVEALEATAADRYWLMRAVDAVHARHRCGSQFVVARMPWSGLSPRDLATLQLHADSTADAECPDVTREEALVFAARSHHIQRQAGEREALERLVAWVAAAVAVHEGRHAADVASGHRAVLECVGCPEGLSPLTHLEGAAYVASFAHDGTAALALFQACGLDPVAVPERAAIVRYLAGELVPGGCASAPPGDLAERARVLEAQVFGRSAPIELIGLPDRLPLQTEPIR